MFVRSRQANCPDSFPFPFQPYSIQDQFMRALYSVVENRKIGIFESPTGTGKTLSLMCSALKWLSDHDDLNHQDLLEKIHEMEQQIKESEAATAKCDDWLSGQYDSIQKKEQLNKLREQLKAMDDYEQKVAEMRKKWKNQMKTSANQRRFKVGASSAAVGNEKELLDNDENAAKPAEDDEDLVLQDNDNDSDGDDCDQDPDGIEDKRFENTKIFFCSRTHSQLSQVVNELKKTIYGNQIRIIQLASRQQFCINPEVRALNSNALINERCLELKKGKSKSTCCQSTQADKNGRATKKSRVTKARSTTCPYYTQTAIQEVAHTAIYNTESIMDIEDLIEVAKEEKGCPYYAARAAAKDAQVVMLPYQMLLHRKTREQLDISIKDSVIIIDEAHNLLDTIASIHSAEITADQLQRVHQQLMAYKIKYMDRFSTANLLRLNQLISIAGRFARLIKTPSVAAGKTQKSSQTEQQQQQTQGEFTSEMVLTHDLLDEINIPYGNLFEILKFCEESRLAQKLGGFALRYANTEVILATREPPKKPQQPQKPAHLTYLQQLSEKVANKNQNKKSTEVEKPVENDEKKPLEPENRLGSASVIRVFLTFLETLLEKSTDGRILLSKHRTIQSKSFLKYLLLNASEPFDQLLRECRAVIVAGGTMQPTTEFKTQLFQHCPQRIEEHFYGHVVSADAILPMAISKGPRNSSFLFNYANRGNKEMMSDLAMVIQNICNVIPAGIVCFFTSYDVMDQFYKHLIDTGALERIQMKKKLFKEPRSGGQQTEKMLVDYARAVKNATKCMEPSAQTGALLMSVVGGKLSEGLNFSDDLGRCVCVVGLPFPNKNSPELSEKMKYLDKIAAEQKSTASSNVVGFSSTEYYENLCMKAVNQCIGRAIRHINDYASVLLIDERYQQERIKRKLPTWIQTSLRTPNNFGAVQGQLVKFFKQRKTSS